MMQIPRRLNLVAPTMSFTILLQQHDKLLESFGTILSLSAHCSFEGMSPRLQEKRMQPVNLQTRCSGQMCMYVRTYVRCRHDLSRTW